MMRKSILSIIIMIVFGFSMIVSIPMIFLSISFSPHYIIEHHKDYYYTNKSINPSVIKSLNINTDIGEIDIKYTYFPVDYYVKIEVDMELISQNIAGKSYLDYFNEPFWQNTSNSLMFTMELKTDAFDAWFEPSYWISQKVNLIITINPNVLFNINTTIYEKGDVKLEVKGGINVNNVNINTKQGNILYDFIWCTIKGNITGFAGSGDIKLKANNIKYTKNNIWTLINDEGLITFNIIQNRAMEANLTGFGKTNTGEIKIIYSDYSSNIGAKFTFHNYSGSWGGIYNAWVGFPEDPQSFYDPPDVGYIFKSFDFPTKNNYNLTLYKSFTFGDYTVNLSSIPFN